MGGLGVYIKYEVIHKTKYILLKFKIPRYFQIKAVALKYPTLTEMMKESGGDHTDTLLSNQYY